jgi:hypothetical protein
MSLSDIFIHDDLFWYLASFFSLYDWENCLKLNRVVWARRHDIRYENSRIRIHILRMLKNVYFGPSMIHGRPRRNVYILQTPVSMQTQIASRICSHFYKNSLWVESDYILCNPYRRLQMDCMKRTHLSKKEKKRLSKIDFLIVTQAEKMLFKHFEQLRHHILDLFNARGNNIGCRDDRSNFGNIRVIFMTEYKRGDLPSNAYMSHVADHPRTKCITLKA